MSKRDPAASARRSSVRIDGRVRPLSKRATTGCVVPILRASSCCVRPARFRTSITAEARTNSSSSASYALRYFGCFIHFLCISDMRAIRFPPSSDQLSAGQGKIYVAPRRFLRFLYEYPHDHHAPARRRHVQRPRNSAPALKSHFPKAALYMFDVRLAHMLQTLFLDELRYSCKPGSHVFRQGLDLCIDNFIQSLNRPRHILLYQKRYSLREPA